MVALRPSLPERTPAAHQESIRSSTDFCGTSLYLRIPDAGRGRVTSSKCSNSPPSGLKADWGRPPRGSAPYANWYANQPDSGGVHGCTPTYGKRSDLQKLDTHEHRRTPCLNLGVKWSQVQILSARLSPTQHCPRSKAMMVNRGIPRWVSIGVSAGRRYSFLVPSRSSAEKVARASLTSSSAAPGHTPLRRCVRLAFGGHCLQVTDQPNHSGGSSSHILAVSRMRSATASTDARALSPEPPPPCGIGKMNRPLFPHCQTAEKSSRLRGRKMTSVRASLSTTSSHVSYSPDCRSSGAAHC